MFVTSRVLLPLLLAVAPVALAAQAVPKPATTQLSPAEAEDLSTIVDYASLGNMQWSLSEQAIAVMYRNQLMSRGADVELEKKYPGLTQAKVDAALAYIQQSLVADMPKTRADYEAVFRRELTAAERAEIAKYIRSPIPQRVINARIAMQIGETTSVAMQRTFAEITAEKTDDDTKREDAFAASAAGKKYGTVMDRYQRAIVTRQQTMTRDRLQAALGRAEAAGQDYMTRRAR